AGDFRNSGIWPTSNIQPIPQPHNQPSTAPNKEAKKKRISAVPSGFVAVIYAMISNANTANKAPIGSTIIPSHFKILAGRGFSFDCLSNGKITVGPVTMNKPPMTKATAHDNPAI